MSRKYGEIGIQMQNGRVHSYGDGGNETVNQLANGFALHSATAIERGGIIVICGPSRYHSCPRKQSLKIQQMRFVPCPGEYFHPNRVADDDIMGQQIVNEIAH